MIDKNTLEQIKSAQKHAEKLNTNKYTGSAFEEFVKKQSSALEVAKNITAAYEPLKKELNTLQNASFLKQLENIRTRLDSGEIKNQFPKISNNPENVFQEYLNNEKPSKFEFDHFLPQKNPVLDSIYDVKDILRQMVESMIDSNKKHNKEAEIFKNLLELNQMQFESSQKDSEYLRQTNNRLLWIASLTLIATIGVPILLLLLK